MRDLAFKTHTHMLKDTSEQGNQIPAAKKTPARLKRRVVAPAETRTQLRLTVDSKFTKCHFSQLFAVLKIRRKNALAEEQTVNY